MIVPAPRRPPRASPLRAGGAIPVAFVALVTAAVTSVATAQQRMPAPIPRAALVDVARAQSGVICASGPFLACMGLDATECVALLETAIERCLLTLPEEIDPTGLDGSALEDCPRAVYEEAGHDEARALACLEEATGPAGSDDAGDTEPLAD